MRLFLILSILLTGFSVNHSVANPFELFPLVNPWFIEVMRDVNNHELYDSTTDIDNLSYVNPGNIRIRMLSEIPTGYESIMRTYFAYIGELYIDGQVYFVAHDRRIIKGMSAPRGLQQRMYIFDEDVNLVFSFQYGPTSVLWCANDRIYFFGFLNELETTSRNGLVDVDPKLDSIAGHNYVEGNVLDFSAGPDRPVLTREKEYGSSGGVFDDPWRRHIHY